MKPMIARLFIAGWFVGMVLVAVRGTPVQGQSEGGQPKQYFPTLMRNAPASPNPVVHGYIGVGAANGDIYTVRADGTELYNLTSNLNEGEYAFDPRFSADGTLISFLHSFGATHVMVMNRDGSQPRLLLANNFAEHPQVKWTPTGRQLLVWGERLNSLTQKDLFLVSVDSNTVEHLVDATASDEIWGWSPDGNYIYYQRDAEVWVRPSRGGREVRLNEANPVQVVWHPWRHELFLLEFNGTEFSGRIASADGTFNRLLFTGDYRFQGWVQGQDHLLLLNSDASPFLYLLPHTGGLVEPLFPDSTAQSLHVESIAPDGQAMVYDVGFTNTRESYVYDFSSNTQYRLIENPSPSISSVTWSHNKRELIYVHTYGSDRSTYSAGVYVSVNPDGGTRLELFGGYPYFSSWSAQYLPFSSRHAIAQYVGGYPPPHRQEYQLLLDNTPGTDHAVPFAPEVPMIAEWRYLP